MFGLCATLTEAEFVYLCICVFVFVYLFCLLLCHQVVKKSISLRRLSCGRIKEPRATLRDEKYHKLPIVGKKVGPFETGFVYFFIYKTKSNNLKI